MITNTADLFILKGRFPLDDYKILAWTITVYLLSDNSRTAQK